LPLRDASRILEALAIEVSDSRIIETAFDASKIFEAHPYRRSVVSLLDASFVPHKVYYCEFVEVT
jgi:hypothetical protein